MTLSPEKPHHDTERINWRGITLDIRFWPERFGAEHLEIFVISPERAPLPVTQSGYRSEFLPPGTTQAAGGPVAYAIAWLDHAAQCPRWIQQEDHARQLSLF